MKHLLTLFILTLSVGLINAQDFRKANWGMSVKEVLRSEKQKWKKAKIEGMDVRYFITEVGLSAMAAYFFAKGKLFSTNYAFEENHTNKNEFIYEFSEIAEILENKYGPADERIEWNNDLYRDKPEDYGLAVSIGHLSLHNIWETENEEIIQVLSGDNYEISHVLQYRSKEFIHLKDEVITQKHTSEF